MCYNNLRWKYSSAGMSVRLTRERSWVRAPLLPLFITFIRPPWNFNKGLLLQPLKPFYFPFSTYIFDLQPGAYWKLKNSLQPGVCPTIHSCGSPLVSKSTSPPNFSSNSFTASGLTKTCPPYCSTYSRCSFASSICPAASSITALR